MLSRIAKAVARRSMSWVSSPQTIIALFEPFFHANGFRRKPTALALSKVESVLVVRLDEIGDAVMTTPMLRELRRNAPAAWITLVVNPANLNLFETCPYVNEVLAYDWRAPGSYQHVRRQQRALNLARKFLWKRRFDLAILPRWDYDEYNSNFLAYLSGAQRRIGFADNVVEHKKLRRSGHQALLTQVVEDDSIQHEARRPLQLLEALGGVIQSNITELWTTPEDDAFARTTLGRESAEARWVALAPGASAAKRTYPAERFAQIGAALSALGYRVLLVGGPADAAPCAALAKLLGDAALDMSGQTTLRQTCALLSHCDLFVGNDSGPMHLSAAHGVPAVEISCHPKDGNPLHPNSPQRFAPWETKSAVLQPRTSTPPCASACTSDRPHCILQVSAEDAIGAARILLASPHEKETAS